MTDLSTDAFDRLSEGLCDFRAMLQELRDMVSATMNPVVLPSVSSDPLIDHVEQVQITFSAKIATRSTLNVLENHVVKLATLQKYKQRRKYHPKNESGRKKAAKLDPWRKIDQNRIKHRRIMSRDVEILGFLKTQYPRPHWLDPITHRKLQGGSQIDNDPQVLLSPGRRRKLNLLV